MCRLGVLTSTYNASGRIRFLSVEDVHVDSAAKQLARIAIVTDDKKLITLSLNEVTTPSGDVGAELAFVDETRVAKRGTAITRIHLHRASASGSASSTTQEPVLCVSDKWGDVHAFPDPAVSTKRRTLLTHTGCIITSLFSSLDARYLISADREERIRVSHFPNCYDIQSFCLGHSRFVSTVTILRQPVNQIGGTPGYAPGDLLVSGGADGALRLFHWLTGTLVHTAYLHPGETIDWGRRYLFGPGEAPDGLYSCTTSAGPHDDAAMNSEAADEDDGEKSEAPEEEAGAPSKKSRPNPPGESDPDTASATGSSTPLIPRAFNPERQPTLAAPPVVPVMLTECPASGLLATFIEGEHAVRLFKVSIPAEPARIPVSASHVPDASSPAPTLPQARLSQVCVLKLDRRPLSVRFDPVQPGLLLVGTVGPVEGSDAFAYRVLAFSMEASDAAAPAYTARPVDADSLALLKAVNPALAALTRMPAAEAEALRASFFCDKLEEYDKSVKVDKAFVEAAAAAEK